MGHESLGSSFKENANKSKSLSKSHIPNRNSVYADIRMYCLKEHFHKIQVLNLILHEFIDIFHLIKEYKWKDFNILQNIVNLNFVVSGRMKIPGLIYQEHSNFQYILCLHWDSEYVKLIVILVRKRIYIQTTDISSINWIFDNGRGTDVIS